MDGPPLVVTVGSVHVDLVANADRLPRRGETLPGHDFAVHPGGKGGNQAVAAARAGVRSALVARVGDDVFGRQLLAAMTEAGVAVDRVSVDPIHPTGASTVLVGEGNDYASVIVPGAAARLDGADLAAADDLFARAAVLLLQLEIPSAASLRAAELARAAGATVVLSAAPVPADLAPVEGLLRAADVLLANAGEAAALAGQRVDGVVAARDAATVIRRRYGCAAVVVTLGPDGLVAVERDDSHAVPGWPVGVVATLGAGDALAGILAAELARGESLGSALRLANAAGALAVTRAGAHDAAPTADEVRAFLAARGG